MFNHKPWVTPPFGHNMFLIGELIYRFCKDQWACRAKIQPTSEEMKSNFTFYHVLLMRPTTGNNHMIPSDGLRYTPAVAMLNHLSWFL
jgi:hypothetical protein